MTTIKKFRECENFLVVGAVEENGKLLHFTAADRNLEILTTQKFQTANGAFEWAEKNYKDLYND